ncbi:hypothetical protein [Salinimicrobium sp. TH3]|uniref:hypothetical protein n=1 Tax=Salinimicrobium sp. TH3 TaxID=2997342 RepID=UPI002273A1D3|nr:hypothetical protein [Salinimicrobium sp. TH3]MCY2688305.1 hypothetical protein [Salinimicrobium sp. TH3]
MKGISFMKLSCSEAAELCEKAEYKEVSLREKIKLKLHLYFCRMCKNYYQDNKKLSGLLKKADLKACSHQEKENFKEKIKQENSQVSNQQKKH